MKTVDPDQQNGDLIGHKDAPPQEAPISKPMEASTRLKRWDHDALLLLSVQARNDCPEAEEARTKLQQNAVAIITQLLHDSQDQFQHYTNMLMSRGRH